MSTDAAARRSGLARTVLAVLSWLGPDGLPVDVLAPIADDTTDVERYEALVSDYRRALGDLHPDTLTTAGLARAYLATGHRDAAIRAHEDVLRRRRESFGDGHPFTRGSEWHLAAARSHPPVT
ncbi:tetratricopeptide repeat protein [Dactylosporangium sp. NPDC049742]|uniref:tetratricopeptide repeat protein n=1 Tax=Dactylosporangium sp. NPDC049742 TaxID=3154737 RepID=UPI00343E696A